MRLSPETAWWAREWEFSSLLEILRLYANAYCRLMVHVSNAAMQIASVNESQRDGEMAEQIIGILVPLLGEMDAECKRIGMEASSNVIGLALERWQDYHDMRLLMTQCASITQVVEKEFKSKVCFILPRSSQEIWANPVKGWEEILKAFPDTQGDVEEMSKCRAFGRDAGAVFHVLLVVEHGLIELGKFVGVVDPKPGWEPTCKAVDKIVNSNRNNLSPQLKEHFSFLELINKDMNSMKAAWRNKVSHAANHLFVMTSDFRPEVAEKIITACHGFMLLMATEGPSKK
jgi:hypothetical protein